MSASFCSPLGSKLLRQENCPMVLDAWEPPDSINLSSSWALMAGGLNHIALGSVAEAIVRVALCSVLVVRLVSAPGSACCMHKRTLVQIEEAE
jgi:hypothetical protein